ncbi:MAG: SelT/SelW/SelH family protein [Halobacteriaceae archaeon]
MTDVEIEYCHPCGYLDRAQDLEHAILEAYGLELDGVRLQVGDGGVFQVRVDGEQVFDVDDEEYDVDAIVDRVGDHVGA